MEEGVEYGMKNEKYSNHKFRSLLRQKAVQKFLQRKIRFIKFLLYCLWWYVVIVLGFGVIYYLAGISDDIWAGVVYSLNIMLKREKKYVSISKVEILNIFEHFCVTIVLTYLVIARAVKLFLQQVNPISLSSCAVVYSTKYESPKGVKVDIKDQRKMVCRRELYEDVRPDQIAVRYWIMLPRGKFLYDVKLRMQLIIVHNNEDNGNECLLDMSQNVAMVRGIRQAVFNVEKDNNVDLKENIKMIVKEVIREFQQGNEKVEKSSFAISDAERNFNQLCDKLYSQLFKDEQKDKKKLVEKWRLLVTISGIDEEGRVVSSAKSYDIEYMFLNSRFANIEIDDPKHDSKKGNDKRGRWNGSLTQGEKNNKRYRFQNFNKIVNRDINGKTSKEFLAVTKQQIEKSGDVVRVLTPEEEKMRDVWYICFINRIIKHYYREWKLSTRIIQKLLKKMEIDL